MCNISGIRVKKNISQTPHICFLRKGNTEKKKDGNEFFAYIFIFRSFETFDYLTERKQSQIVKVCVTKYHFFFSGGITKLLKVTIIYK